MTRSEPPIRQETNPTPDHEAAWHRFWAQGQPQAGGGCLPARWAPIERAQAAAWRTFAAALPSGANVLDLATGDGRVLTMLRADRADLVATGVDFAPRLPAPPPGVTLRGGVRMEQLPFEDASFDAVTSQFGFEYGDPAAIAMEIARVVKPAGILGLLVHRGDGPILAHNLARSEQIAFALDGPALTDADLTQDRFAQTLREAEGHVAAAIEAFGQASVAWEISEAFRRSVVLVQALDAEQAAIAVRRIREEATAERARIASLAAACRTADDQDGLDQAFTAAGLRLADRSPVVVEGAAIADLLTLYPR